MSMRRINKKVLIFILGIWGASAVWGGAASIFEFDHSAFAKIPVLHEGRVKPLDTFAATYLETFNSKAKLAHTKPIEWLAEALMDPEKARRREIFDVPNPKVIDALELERRPGHRYSYDELSQAMMGHFKTLHPIFTKPREELSLAQSQLLDIYAKMGAFEEIVRSLVLMSPDFEIAEGEPSQIFGVPAGTFLTYMDVRLKQEALQQVVMKIVSQNKTAEGHGAFSEEDMKVIGLVQRMREIEAGAGSEVLRVIPPQWEESKDLWFSPSSITQVGHGSPKSAQFLQSWKDLVNAYRSGDNTAWFKASKEIYSSSLEMAGKNASGKKLSLEVMFNRGKFFTQSFTFYLMAFLVILAGMMFWGERLRRSAFVLLGVGFLFHTIGLVVRTVIMGRPPVSNLYESIIFVGFIAVSFGILLEGRKKNSLGIIIASLVGASLHLLGFKYDAGGDTMGMLVAVLNTKFWLTTHVITITIGYGCCFVGGAIGHIYLLQRLLRPSQKERLAECYKNMQGVSFVALFFTALGTILGGIWADQSWGRFWGWDPKENGALLIVLWMVWLIHGRLSAKISDLGFAVGMVCTNIVVALAWFGVNLLNVGLHSYGFTENAALNLAVFCLAEFFFALGSYLIIRIRKI